MFENTVRNAAYPMVLELLTAFEHALEEVQEGAKVDHARAGAEGDVAGLAANAAILSGLRSVQPAVSGMIDELEAQHHAAGAHAAPVARQVRRRHGGHNG